MKRIEFIAPVEALRGNMSGKQTLVYAQNDNPAYDAPEGRQYARNYKPRYIGYRRAKDGAVYFGVKRKSATMVDAASKITMAALGTIQDLKKTFKNEDIQITVGGISGTYWAYILLAYRTEVNDGTIDPNISVDKWIDGLLIDMMRYRQDSITLYVQRPNETQRYNFDVPNPYTSMDTNTVPISQRNFIKFNPTLTTITPAPVIYINGMAVVFEGNDSETWSEMKSAVSPTNPNYTAQLTPLVAGAGTSTVTWNGKNLYSAAGVTQTGDTPLQANERYTTSPVSA